MTTPAASPAPPGLVLERFVRHLVRVEGYAVLALEGPGGLRSPGLPSSGDEPGCTWVEIPELAPLAGEFDLVLVRSDGLAFDVLCLRDRDVSGPVAVPRATLLEAGKACLRYTGKVHGTKLPVSLRVLELVRSGEPDAEHLRPLRHLPLRAKVALTASAVRLDGDYCWTNAPLRGWFAAGRLQKLVARLARGDEPATAPARVGVSGPPVVTLGLIVALALMLAAQVALGPWNGLLSPNFDAIVAAGGLARNLVLGGGGGDWYRLVSAGFLHGGLVHLAMNALALLIGGAILERLVGHAWFASVYGLALLGGSAASLLLNGPDALSVGASGAIMGVLAAGFVATTRLPHGSERAATRVQLAQMLVPALIPIARHPLGGRIDFAAHLGGAVTGGLLGLALLRAWPRGDARPRWRRPARVLAAALGLAAAAALAQAFAARPALQHAFDVRRLVAPDDRFKDVFALPAPEASEVLAKLEREFPRDPRTSLLAAVLAGRRDALRDAEARLRQALAERDVLTVAFADGRLETILRSYLAQLLLARGADAEAREAYRPICDRTPHELAAPPAAWAREVCGR